VGTAASLGLVLAGLGLSSAGLGDVTVDSAAFADSWSIGLMVQAALGDALANPEVGSAHCLLAGGLYCMGKRARWVVWFGRYSIASGMHPQRHPGW
jgi:hypothetical protein